MSRFRHWTVAAAALGIIMVAGCNRKPGAQQGRTFGVVVMTMNNPFFVELTEGIKEVVEGHGDHLIVLDSQRNSTKQLNDLSDLLLQGSVGLFINPVNWEGIKGSLLKARDRTVPCIVVDSPVKDEDLVLSQVASDNVEAGRLACRALAEVQPEARVVIIHHSIAKSCIDR